MARVYHKDKDYPTFEPTKKEDWWKLTDDELKTEWLYRKVNLDPFNDFADIIDYMIKVRNIDEE